MKKMSAATLLTSALALAAAISSSPSRALTLLTEENPPLNYTENGKLTLDRKETGRIGSSFRNVAATLR